MAEFDLIARIAARTPPRGDVHLGIGDDGAVLACDPARQLVVVTDMLNSGVHFPPDTGPADIGWKALAVNLSDLAAMGAEPAWCTLALSMPAADERWLDAFLDGFLALARQHDVALVGGDTTRGPLSIGVTVLGWVEAGSSLRRDGARVGDDVWVSGTLGDAALALQRRQWHRPVDDGLRAWLERPIPRVALGRALRGVAHACIDLSDGLLQDVGHIAAASGVAVQIMVDRLPISAAFVRTNREPGLRRLLQASGGDDYELCFTAAVSERDRIAAIGASCSVALTHVGRVMPGAGVQAVTDAGEAWEPPRSGFEHFG